MLKPPKSHGNRKKGHAKAPLFLHKVNLGQPPSPAGAFSAKYLNMATLYVSLERT